MADIVIKTANLFDFDTMSEGIYGSFLKSDGTIQSQGGWNVSDYIPCNDTEFTLQIPGGGVSTSICLYDSSKNYITGVAYSGNTVVTIQTASSAAYIRISLRTSWTKTDVMLNTGSTALPFAPYWSHSLKKYDGATWQNATVHEF